MRRQRFERCDGTGCYASPLGSSNLAIITLSHEESITEFEKTRPAWMPSTANAG